MAGSKIIQLGATARALTARMQQAVYGPASPNSSAPSIVGIPANAWPNPLQPVKPFGPDGSESMQFNIFEGQNLTYTPRPDAEYTAAQLRSLARYPLARICIENVKDIVCQTEWSIGLKPIPGETQKDRAKRQKGDDNIVNLSRFFEYPDGEIEWPLWSRVLMENMLTIDAAVITPERSRRGKVSALYAIEDGGTITRYVDQRARTPQPPSVAYSQLWFGLPRVDFTTEELLYGVRNIVPRDGVVSSCLYGTSPTEAIAQELEIGIERLNFVKAYYSSGSIPDVIQMAPPGIDPKKVEEAMRVNNAVLSGNLQRRRMWTILQGFSADGKDQVLFPKEPLLADPFDDMHIRKVCYAYGDSPQRLMKMINRSSSESNQTASEEEGITPWVIWLQGLINRIIQRYMGMVDYEITFKQERESDIKKLMETDVGYVKNGGYSWNERRELRGDDPRPEPEADELGIVTANGWLPIGSTFQPVPGGGDSGSEPDDGSTQSPVGRPGSKTIRLIPRGQKS